MQQRSLTLNSALGFLLLGIGSVAMAQYAKPAAMTEAQVTAKLKAAGYANVHDVEREGSHFDADAMKDGKAVHLHVDAATGAIQPVAHESEEEEEHEMRKPARKP